MAAKKSAKKAGAKKKASAAKGAKKKAAPKKAAKKAAPKKAAKKAAPKKAAKKAAPKKGAASAAEGKDGGVDPAMAKLVAQLVAAEDEGEAPRVLKPIPRMPKRAGGDTITLAAGAHPVAAFMLYALAGEKVDTGGRTYKITRVEQHALDAGCGAAKHDVVMMSLGAYPTVDAKYMLLPCGGSFGDGRGPILVARRPIRSGEVEGLQVGVPGAHSGAALALQLWLSAHKLSLLPMPAPTVSLRVRANQIRSGLLVREDQTTYRAHGLVPVVDLGHWWADDTEGLPLPLQVAGIRRDIDAEERAAIALDLKRSIAYALGHREESLEHALQYARKVESTQLDKYVDCYVNDLSLDSSLRGRQAIEGLFKRSFERKLIPEAVEVVFHGDEDADG